MVYLERAIVAIEADALHITNNFLCECGSCVELVGSGQASMVNDNLIGAGPTGFSIFAEDHFGLIISGNNIFPRGKSSVHLKNATNNMISANRLHAFYSGMITMEGACHNNLISANHFLRNRESFPAFQNTPHPEDDLFGLVHVRGSGNAVNESALSRRPAARSSCRIRKRPRSRRPGGGRAVLRLTPRRRRSRTRRWVGSAG